MYSVQYTVYTVQCTIYGIWCTANKILHHFYLVTNHWYNHQIGTALFIDTSRIQFSTIETAQLQSCVQIALLLLLWVEVRGCAYQEMAPGKYVRTELVVVDRFQLYGVTPFFTCLDHDARHQGLQVCLCVQPTLSLSLTSTSSLDCLPPHDKPTLICTLPLALNIEIILHFIVIACAMRD